MRYTTIRRETNLSALAKRIYGVSDKKAVAVAAEALVRANPGLKLGLTEGIPVVVPALPSSPAPPPEAAPELKAGSGGPPFARTLDQIRDVALAAAKDRKQEAEAQLTLSESKEVKKLADQDSALRALLAAAVKHAAEQQKLPSPLDDQAFDKLQKATALLLGLRVK